VKAVCIEPTDQGTTLVVRALDEPSVGPQDILVDVRASALNRADLRRAAAHFAASQETASAAIGGLEMAGEVVAVGPEVDGISVGDRVMAMTGGAWAERVALDHRLAVFVPTHFDWRQAAATPISFMTAFDALTNAAQITPGETVLVQGASSSAGIASVQLADVLGARQVIGTSTTGWKVQALQDLGCHAVQAGTDAGDVLATTVNEVTGGTGVNIIIDIVGQGAVQQNIDAAAIGARIICLGRLAGTEGCFNLDEFSRKRIHMIGVTFRTRTLAERFQVVEHFRSEVVPLLEKAVCEPVVDRTFPLDSVLAAEIYMRSGAGFGKIIIDVALS
jgi:NADPH2:quinone reductase